VEDSFRQRLRTCRLTDYWWWTLWCPSLSKAHNLPCGWSRGVARACMCMCVTMFTAWNWVWLVQKLSLDSQRLCAAIGLHFVILFWKTSNEHEQQAHPVGVHKICLEKSKNSVGKREIKETVQWCPDCKEPLYMPRCFRLHHIKPNFKIGNVFCSVFFPPKFSLILQIFCMHVFN
jgi:hypothetical protein